jgi:hypothetical protein
VGKKERKKEKKGKVGKQNAKKKSKKKKKRNALWITVVIHSAFGSGETVISPHPLVICINVYRKIMWENTAEIHSILKKKLQSENFNQLNS